MILTLTPVSHPELEPIVVSERLFSVGRGDAPFADYDRNVVSRMSKRHAKIFMENDAAYVADLDSTNGTTLNGTPVSVTPARLNDNDVLEFGDLEFRVAIDDGRAARPDSDAPAATVVLAPMHDQRGLVPVVITEFPYLVQRQGDMFAGSDPDQAEYVSKRHAHIFQRGGEIMLEDLGSTNGTFVNGEKLTEQPRVLRERDTLAFGSEYFVYRVGISVSEDTSTRTSIMEEFTSAPGTIFVESPTSFIDIFRTGSGVSPQPPGRDDPSEAVASQTGAEPAAPRQPAPPGRRRRRRWPVPALTAAVLVCGAAAVWWFAGRSGVDDLYRMLDQGDYRGAAATANELLEVRGFDAEIARIATSATLHDVLPDWSAAAQAGNRERGAAALQRASALGQANPRDDSYLELLQWALEVRVLLRELDRNEISPAAYVAEADTLLAWWQRDEDARHAALDEITGYVPFFDTQRRGILAATRTMMLRKQQLETQADSD